MIDRIHTTATSHGRVMVIEIMGNKAGWLTLYSGVAGGADVVLLPEIPYDIDNVVRAVNARAKRNKSFSIIAVAEGAMDKKEAGMKRKERVAARAEEGFTTISARIARQIEQKTGIETRAVVPGHIQRGGSPSAYDRVLATRFGVHAAELIRDGVHGVSVALKGDEVIHNPLSEVAGITKFVPPEHQMVRIARNIGIRFGDEK